MNQFDRFANNIVSVDLHYGHDACAENTLTHGVSSSSSSLVCDGNKLL